MILRDIMQKCISEYDQYTDRVSGDSTISGLIAEKAFFDNKGNIAVVDDNNALIGSICGEVLNFLMEAERNFRTDHIMEYFDEGIIIVDATGRIFYINSEYSKIMGVPKYKIIGKYIQDVEAESQLVKVLKTKEELTAPKVYVKSVKKSVSVKIHPFYIGNTFAGAFSIFKDVTELTNLNREFVQISGIADSYKRKIEAMKAEKEVGVIGESPQFLRALNKAYVVAPTDATAMICGENGSGKEIIAKLIHQNSSRKNRPLITVNCAAIPENLIESELFGYEEGAFTGASKGGKVGKFELAHEGTLFLDEIGDMPLHMQAKLLRVLQNGEIEKIGREANIPVNVRVISATNQSLEELVENKKFRRDLYYRLNVVRIDVPPLRNRGHDIILLANYFLDKYNRKYNKQAALSENAGICLERYNWPGNVRELENVIESAVIMCSEGRIEETLLPVRPGNVTEHDFEKIYSNDKYEALDLKSKLQLIEKEIIIETLKECDGNRALAMKKLGINQRTFYRRLENLDIN